MSVLAYKLIFLAIVLAVAVIGGLPLFRKSQAGGEGRFLAHGEALAAGIFLGAGLIHMLDDSDDDFYDAGIEYPWGTAICGAMILSLLYLEHLANRIAERREITSTVLPILTTVILCVHSFLVGAALATNEELAIVFVIFLAVLAHKGAAAFALSLQLMRSSLARPVQFVCFGLFVVMLPLGIVAGTTAEAVTSDHPLWEPVFSALAAGTFLYLGSLHGLAANVLVTKCRDTVHFGLVVLGFLAMAGIAIVA